MVVGFNLMKNLIIISNIPKPDFGTRIANLKTIINNSNITNWSNLPFLNRTIIISNNETNSFKLMDFLIQNKVSLGLETYILSIKENFTTISNTLEVDHEIDLHYENVIKPSNSHLKINTDISAVNQSSSPSITITPIDL